MLTPQWHNYELLDSGNGRKLERFGEVIVDRVETQALWRPSNTSLWKDAHALFEKVGDKQGKWRILKSLPKLWTVSFEGVVCQLQCTPFGHVGIFPEQAVQWNWMTKKIQSAKRDISLLNLFSYTGASTLVGARAGASVVHVDASKPAITWARKNQELSGLQKAPVRWIPDDAVKFVKRELRRGNTYDAIILDPPKYGRGTHGEVWQFEDAILPLLLDVVRLLSKKPLFLLVNAYAVPISPTTLQNVLTDAVGRLPGKVEAGELGLAESSSGRVLPMSLFARFDANPLEKL